MAKKKAETKIELKRTYNIPLRKEFMKSPRGRRSKRAISALRRFLMRHMKSTEIRIGRYLNQKIWEHGIRNPPHHVKVEAEKDSDGIVRAELAGAKIEEDKRFKKKKGTKKEKREGEKTIPKKAEEVKEEKEAGVEEEIKEKGDIKADVTKTKKRDDESKHAEKEKAVNKKAPKKSRTVGSTQ